MVCSRPMKRGRHQQSRASAANDGGDRCTNESCGGKKRETFLEEDMMPDEDTGAMQAGDDDDEEVPEMFNNSRKSKGTVCKSCGSKNK